MTGRGKPPHLCGLPNPTPINEGGRHRGHNLRQGGADHRGNRGIGAALVAEALHRGARRVYVGTRKALAGNGDSRVTPLALDITDPAQIRRAVARVDSLDVLVNNAGLAVYDDLGDAAALRTHLAVNLLGTYDVIQAFLPMLTRSGDRSSTTCR